MDALHINSLVSKRRIGRNRILHYAKLNTTSQPLLHFKHRFNRICPSTTACLSFLFQTRPSEVGIDKRFLKLSEVTNYQVTVDNYPRARVVHRTDA